MSVVPESLRRKIADEAGHCCSYCQTQQRISGAQMQVDHIIPLASGGATNEANLCLACAWCNSYKGAKTHGVDPLSGEIVPLFHPKNQRWSDHFRWNNSRTRIVGLTATGRATVEALRMNNEFIVPARRY